MIKNESQHDSFFPMFRFSVDITLLNYDWKTIDDTGGLVGGVALEGWFTTVGWFLAPLVSLPGEELGVWW